MSSCYNKKLFKVSVAEITCCIHEQAKCFDFTLLNLLISFFFYMTSLWHVFMLCQINVSFQFRPPWWAPNQWMCVSKFQNRDIIPFQGGKKWIKHCHKKEKKKDLTLWFNIELSFIVQLVRHLIKEAMACLHWRYLSRHAPSPRSSWTLAWGISFPKKQ